MELFNIVDNLYQSPLIDNWEDILNKGINVVIDLEGTLDSGVPENITYVYWAIEDGPLPDTNILWAITGFGAPMVKNRYKFLTHCAGGFNRSSLMNACILKKPDPNLNAEEIVEIIKKARPGTLSNPKFLNFIKGL